MFYQKLCQKKFVDLIEINNFANLRFFRTSHTLEVPYNEKLEHRRPLCIERERDPLHILLVATRCYAYYMMRAVSVSVMPCE